MIVVLPIVTLGFVAVPKELLEVDLILTVCPFVTVPEVTSLPPAILTVQPLTLTDNPTFIPPTVIAFESTVVLRSTLLAFVKSLGLKVGVLSVAVVTTNVLVVVPTVIFADVVFPPLPVAFSEKVIVVPFTPLLALTDPAEVETDAVSPVPKPAIVYVAVPADPLAAVAVKLLNPEGVISTAADACTWFVPVVPETKLLCFAK